MEDQLRYVLTPLVIAKVWIVCKTGIKDHIIYVYTTEVANKKIDPDFLHVPFS